MKLETKAQRLAQPVVEDQGAELLHDQAGHVVLQRLRSPRQHRDGDGQREEVQHAGHALVVAAAGDRQRVAVDDLPEDDRIDQRQHLAGRGQHQREQGQPVVRPQVIPEDAHRKGAGNACSARESTALLPHPTGTRRAPATSSARSPH